MSKIKGAGIGLRTPHIAGVLEQELDSIWFEVMADNFLIEGGLNVSLLQAVAERYPLTLHGVGLSIGGTYALDSRYVDGIKSLLHATGAQWYSEHLSFSGNNQFRVPDLLPLPYTEESVRHVVSRIEQVQEQLGQQILMENVSSYIECPFNEMSEAEFMCEVAERADCYLLLDINNVFVSSYNHQQDPQAYLNTIPAQRVKQIHLAGFEDKQSFLLDAHNHSVSPPVWELFETFIRRAGPRPTLVEWDNDLPELDRLLREKDVAQDCLDRVCNPLVAA